LRASSGWRSSINSSEPLMSVNSAVTVPGARAQRNPDTPRHWAHDDPARAPRTRLEGGRSGAGRRARWRPSCGGACAFAQDPGFSKLRGEVVADSRWFADSIQLDVEDVLSSPLYVASPQSPFRSRKFYLTVAAAGVIWGASFGLDKTIQTHVGHMAHSAHDVMENLSYTMLITAAGGTFIYGLYVDHPPARRDPLTGLEAAGLGIGINELLERATGRLRPYQTRSSSAFFAGGRSFTSGDIVIQSALAAGTSAYYQDEWYAAVPLYSLVLLEGFTLIGNNTQWFSDVIGGGLLGFTTAEALLWLHRRQALEPDRWRIFPIANPAASVPSKASSRAPSVGLAIAYSW